MAGDEALEDAELPLGERDLGAVDEGFMAVQVEAHDADLHMPPDPRAAAQERSDPGFQLQGREGLAHVIVRARFESLHTLGNLPQGGE